MNMILVESTGIPVPQNFAIISNGNNFECSWQSPYDIELERLQADGSYQNVYTGNATAFTITNSVFDTGYVVRVRANFSGIVSDWVYRYHENNSWGRGRMIFPQAFGNPSTGKTNNYRWFRFRNVALNKAGTGIICALGGNDITTISNLRLRARRFGAAGAYISNIGLGSRELPDDPLVFRQSSINVNSLSFSFSENSFTKDTTLTLAGDKGIFAILGNYTFSADREFQIEYYEFT